MRFKIVGIGELLWDLLPDGRQLGGAPANFTYHAGALGADARLVSRIGQDDLGREARHLLEKRGVPTDCVDTDASLPTGTVSVEVAPDGQPRFQIHENVAWDAISCEPSSIAIVTKADAVCFGSLAQRSECSHVAIRSLVAAAAPSALRIFDINLRQHYYSRSIVEESLTVANVLKVNDDELPRLAKMLELPVDERSQIAELVERYHLICVAYTRGCKGSLLLRKSEWSSHPGVPIRVVDTVGAGDSFTAAMTIGLLSGWELGRINEMANRVAAFVCTRPGGMPTLPDQLRCDFTADTRI